MSDEDIRRVFDKLDDLAKGQATIQANQNWVMERQREHQELLTRIQNQGCAHYPEHVEAASKITEHENRIDSLEGDRKFLLGAASVTGVSAGSIWAWFNNLLK
jgi:hypothetical protein